AIYQHNMAPDTQSGRPTGQRRSLLKLLAARHQCGRGHNPPRVRFQDSAIHTRRQAKIVRIDDKLAHGWSLAGKHWRPADVTRSPVYTRRIRRPTPAPRLRSTVPRFASGRPCLTTNTILAWATTADLSITVTSLSPCGTQTRSAGWSH